MRQRPTQATGSERQFKSTFEQHETKKISGRDALTKFPIKSLGFVVLGLYIAHWADLYNNLFSPKMNKNALFAGIASTCVYLGIFIYLWLYLKSHTHVRLDYKDLKIHRPFFIETATACIFLSGICFCMAFWPIYHLFTLPLMFVEFLAWVAAISILW